MRPVFVCEHRIFYLNWLNLSYLYLVEVKKHLLASSRTSKQILSYYYPAYREAFLSCIDTFAIAS
jgi:hypothetical protein